MNTIIYTVEYQNEVIMYKCLIPLVVKALRDTADNIESGNCSITDDEAMHLLKCVTHKAMSREEACDYVNMNANKFNDYVVLGKLPRGRKRRGFKELVWYQDELDDAISLMRNGR